MNCPYYEGGRARKIEIVMRRKKKKREIRKKLQRLEPVNSLIFPTT
jgi:hypothetical protein